VSFGILSYLTAKNRDRASQVDPASAYGSLLLCPETLVGGVKRTPTTTRPHQQTRQRSIALPAGGSRAGDGAQRSAMAQPVLSPGHAAWAQDRQGGDGAQAGNRVVLDVAPRLGLRRNAKARFARGRARTSPWCAVNHRRNDWAPLPFTGEFEVV
jgi:hypothetical protein